MTIYMAITVDEYELPICTADSTTELAQKLGMKAYQVRSAINHNNSGKTKGRKLIKVEVEE